MLAIDVLSAYVICGAGGLVGAGMVQLAKTSDPRIRRAMNFSSLALLTLGLAVTPIFVLGTPLAGFSQCLFVTGTLMCLVLFDSVVALLSGLEPPSAPQLLAGLAACVGVGLWGAHASEVLQAQSFAVGMALAASMIAWHTWPLVRHPRDGAERVFGVVVGSLVVTSWARAVLVFFTPGEPAADLLHLPAPLVATYAILYSMLPIVITTAMLNMINARLRRQLSMQASTDELTGAITRRALRELAPALLAGRRELSRCVALLMLDLDHFKAVNDRYGHASGDLVLQQTGRVLRSQLRPDALLARYGGEEFVALVPVDDLRGARLVAERVREAVGTTTWRTADGEPIGVTVSVGCTLVGEQEPLEEALARADEALYRAKSEGRNQVQVALSAA